MQLCSKPRGTRGMEPETFRRRGQLLSCPPTTGPCGGGFHRQIGSSLQLKSEQQRPNEPGMAMSFLTLVQLSLIQHRLTHVLTAPTEYLRTYIPTTERSLLVGTSCHVPVLRQPFRQGGVHSLFRNRTSISFIGIARPEHMYTRWTIH